MLGEVLKQCNAHTF